MRQQNKRLTPFGRLVSKALIDRDMTRRRWRRQWGSARSI